MSAVAVSSSLNPDAPLFIPAALLQVEDFSPQWWDLITTTAWFRDHWSREHAHLDEMAEQLDAASLLPDDEDLFYDDQLEQAPAAVDPAPAAAALKTGADLPPSRSDSRSVLKTNRSELICERWCDFPSPDEVLKALNLTSPKGGDAPRGFREKPRHSEKPTKYAGSPKSSAPRVIHQPR